MGLEEGGGRCGRGGSRVWKRMKGRAWKRMGEGFGRG